MIAYTFSHLATTSLPPQSFIEGVFRSSRARQNVAKNLLALWQAIKAVFILKVWNLLKKQGEKRLHRAFHTCFCIAPEVETVGTCRIHIVILSDRAIRSNENRLGRLFHWEHWQWNNFKAYSCAYKCYTLLSYYLFIIFPSIYLISWLHIYSFVFFFSPSSFLTVSCCALISQLAVCMGTPILTPSWIHKAWQRRDEL